MRLSAGTCEDSRTPRMGTSIQRIIRFEIVSFCSVKSRYVEIRKKLRQRLRPSQFDSARLTLIRSGSAWFAGGGATRRPGLEELFPAVY